VTVPVLPSLAFLVFGLVLGSLSTLMFVWERNDVPKCVCPSVSCATAAPTVLPEPTTTTTTTTTAVATTTTTTTPRPTTCVQTKPLRTDEHGHVCGYVDQEPVFMSTDDRNGEQRPWTRQRWVWYRNQRRLPREWRQLILSISHDDHFFASHGVMHAFDDFESNSSYYCGLLPHNVMPWTVTFRSYETWINASVATGLEQPRSLSGQRAPHAPVPTSRAPKFSPSDIAIGVYTSSKFLRTRGHSVRDTYLARHPAHRVFYYTGDVDALGLFDVVAVPGAGEQYSSAFRKQMYALEHMWANAPDAQWFYVIGCDTYVMMDYFLTTLDVYDADEPHYLGCCIGDYPLSSAGLQDKFPFDKVAFASGGGGLVLSRGLMAKLVPAIPDFVANVWPAGNPAVDVATALLAASLGFKVEAMSNMFATLPEQALKYHHTGVEIENSVWHFMHPTKLIDMDEFYMNQKLDRMARLPPSLAAAHLLEFSRHFLKSHFRTLRRTYYERRVMAAMLGDSVAEARSDLDSRLQRVFNAAQADYLRHMSVALNSTAEWWYPNDLVQTARAHFNARQS
jgi:hypothetical protein